MADDEAKLQASAASNGQMKTGKRIRKKLDVAKEARRRARYNAGLPPAERVIPDKRLRPPKHKKKVLDSEIE